MNTSFGYTDTPISGVTAPKITVPVINFNEDYRVKASSAKEATIVNISSPLDQPESIRFAVSEVADVYAGAGLSSEQIIGSKAGTRLLAQLNMTAKVTDESGMIVSYLPLSAHLVIKVPKSAYVTNDLIDTVKNRLIGTLYDNGKLATSALLKGALVPKDL